MREIKFRAWDIERKKMLYKVDLQSDGHVYHPKSGRFLYLHSHLFSDGHWEEIKTCECMQYTGKKDVRSKKVYEFDIVGTGIGNGIIKWDLYFACWIIKYFKYYDGMEKGKEDRLDMTFEVLGNIYENPELLDGHNN